MTDEISMYFRMKGGWRCALLIVGMLVFSPSAAFPETAKARDWAFVRQVLLSYDNKEGRGSVYRWSKSPKYFAFMESPSQQKAARQAVETVNQVLSGVGLQASFMTERRDEYDALIGVIAQSGMQRIWQAAGCGRFVGYLVDGAACVHVDANTDEIDTVFILVDEDQDDHGQASTLLEEVYQSFGVRNDHQIYRESLTYDGPDRTYRRTLAPIDKKVLIFLYQYLEPGDDELTVRRKFDAHWHEIVVY
ncbi:MAG: DUF2927 domain-containing protein [Rhodospirillales bacterium]|nr:DUF2927 domain-containing protein [Rhodospirillales bacterium]MBO6787509.1 DUF2927 domain-containing protein [Rhodospirillales bacterium]